jgi:hypothetical protein
MALVNSIVIDLGGQTVTLTSTSSSNNVEVITYAASTNQITFASRSFINILGTDFLALIAQFNIFHAAILTNFSIILSATTPFTEVENVETNLTSSNEWNFYSIIGAIPEERTVDYSGLGSAVTVNLNNRIFNSTINFTEWVYLLTALNHYKGSVKAFFNL